VIPLLVGIGAAVGAPARFLTDRFVSRRSASLFPWGTFCVNVIASFVLGLVVGTSPRLSAVVGTGFCGALSTWSTFGYETQRLVEDRAVRFAVANVGFSVLAGVAAAALGWALGSAF
jgi:CrcB protein